MTEKTISEIIASTERYIAKLELARAQFESTATGQGYVVTLCGQTVTFDYHEDKPPTPRFEKPHKVVRFSHEHATSVAEGLLAEGPKGKEVGQVVHIWEALAPWIAEQRRHLDLLRKAEIKQNTVEIRQKQLLNFECA